MEAVMSKEDKARKYWQRTISTTQAANLLGVHRMTVLRMIQTGDLPARRIGHLGHWHIPRQAVIDRTRCAECIDCGRCRS